MNITGVVGFVDIFVTWTVCYHCFVNTAQVLTYNSWRKTPWQYIICLISALLCNNWQFDIHHHQKSQDSPTQTQRINSCHLNFSKSIFKNSFCLHCPILIHLIQVGNQGILSSNDCYTLCCSKRLFVKYVAGSVDQLDSKKLHNTLTDWTVNK